MQKQWFWVSVVLFLSGVSFGQSNVMIETVFTSGPVRTPDRIGLAVQFQKAEDLHFYANKETAPGGFALKVEATAKGVSFGPAEFPKHGMFFDQASQKDIEVFVGPFTIFVPIQAPPKTGSAEVTVKVSGIACTSKLCLPPFENTQTVKLDFAAAASWPAIQWEKAAAQSPSPALPLSKVSVTGRMNPQGFSAPVAMALALLAGLSINIMPCVLPILPLIVMRLVEQSRQSPRRRIGLGLAFCGGIILFFIVFAALAAGIKLTTGVAIDWGDHLRYPAVATALFLLIVIMGLFLLDVFSIRLPGSIAGSQGSGQGIAGSVGMGFFAAILSTPLQRRLFRHGSDLGPDPAVDRRHGRDYPDGCGHGRALCDSGFVSRTAAKSSAAGRMDGYLPQGHGVCVVLPGRQTGPAGLVGRAIVECHQVCRDPELCPVDVGRLGILLHAGG